MDREKEIDKMVEIARKNAQKINSETGDCTTIEDDMAALYEAGYRKADGVRREIVGEIVEYLQSIECIFTANLIKKKYGVEVGE